MAQGYRHRVGPEHDSIRNASAHIRMRIEGTLTRWNDERGFGFITPTRGGSEIFVHISAFPRDGRRPAVGEQLTFEIETDAAGKKKAKNLTCPRREVARPRSQAPRRVHREKPSLAPRCYASSPDDSGVGRIHRILPPYVSSTGCRRDVRQPACIHFSLRWPYSLLPNDIVRRSDVGVAHGLRDRPGLDLRNAGFLEGFGELQGVEGGAARRYRSSSLYGLVPGAA